MAKLEIIVHKVGAGHAIHVFTPDGKLIVVDTGCSDDFSPLDWLRNDLKRTHIDWLIVSHPHGDHIKEIDKMRAFSYGAFSRPRGLDEGWVRSDNQGWVKDKLDQYFRMDRASEAAGAYQGDLPGAAAGVQIQTFWAPGREISNLNNFSLVVTVSYGPWTVVLPGDNEASSWQALSAIPAFADQLKRCQVFLASHHGRESGYCGETLPRYLNPGLCVISDGQVRDTDASQKYGARARGLKVVHGSGRVAVRNYISTRSDGYVRAIFERKPDSSTDLTIKVPNG